MASPAVRRGRGRQTSVGSEASRFAPQRPSGGLRRVGDISARCADTASLYEPVSSVKPKSSASQEAGRPNPRFPKKPLKILSVPAREATESALWPAATMATATVAVLSYSRTSDRMQRGSMPRLRPDSRTPTTRRGVGGPRRERLHGTGGAPAASPPSRRVSTGASEPAAWCRQPAAITGKEQHHTCIAAVLTVLTGIEQRHYFV